MEEMKDQNQQGLETYVTPPPQAAAEKSFFSGLRVSLIPSELTGRVGINSRQALIILAVVFLVETVLIGAGYLVLLKVSASRAARMDALKVEVTSLVAETVQLEKEAGAAAAFNAQVVAGVAALDGHVRWTSFLRTLERYVLPSVMCTAMNGDSGTGTVTLDCITRSYRDAAEQIVLLRQMPNLVDLQTPAVSARAESDGTVSGVSFSLGLKVKPIAWIGLEETGGGTEPPNSSTAPGAPAPASVLPAGAPVPIAPAVNTP